METKAHHVLIGVFTVTAIVAAFLLMLFVSGAGGLAPGRSYRIVFNGSVGGLTSGSVVSFNGLKVGEVSGVAIAADNPGGVVASIRINGSTPVKADTKARLESQGLGGAATIALIGGAADAPDLKAEAGQPPTLQGAPSQMQSVLDNIASLAQKTEATVSKLDALVSENSSAVADAIHNLRDFSAALGKNAPALNDTLASIGEAAKHIGPLVDRLDKLSTDADKTMSAIDPDKVREIVNSLAELSSKLNASADKIDGVLASAQNLLGSSDTKGSLAEIGDAAKSIQKLADNLDKRVNEISGGLSRFSNVGLRQYEALAADARHTIVDADHLILSISKNPSSLIFGAR